MRLSDKALREFIADVEGGDPTIGLHMSGCEVLEVVREVLRLRKENRKLKRERDGWKKAYVDACPIKREKGGG